MKHKRGRSPETSGPLPVEEIEPQTPQWSPLARIAFRFCFVYLGLFVLATQVFGSLFLLPSVSFRGFGPVWPMRDVTFWIAEHVFHVQRAAYSGVSNGETIFFWVQTVWLFGLASLATCIWSVLDRERENYVTLHKWFRLVIRLGLASQ